MVNSNRIGLVENWQGFVYPDWLDLLNRCSRLENPLLIRDGRVGIGVGVSKISLTSCSVRDSGVGLEASSVRVV